MQLNGKVPNEKVRYCPTVGEVGQDKKNLIPNNRP